MTNEDRFIASCERVGEADVRQKLNAARYSGQKAIWATDWLEQVESGKSDATKAEETSSRLPKSRTAKTYLVYAIAVILLLVVGTSVVLKLA